MVTSDTAPLAPLAEVYDLGIYRRLMEQARGGPIFLVDAPPRPAPVAAAAEVDMPAWPTFSNSDPMRSLHAHVYGAILNRAQSVPVIVGTRGLAYLRRRGLYVEIRAESARPRRFWVVVFRGAYRRQREARS